MANLDEMSDEELDSLILQTNKQPPVNQGGGDELDNLSDDDLDQLILETQDQGGQSAIQAEQDQANLNAQSEAIPEADLGFFNRIKFALDPLESNRRAFLVQEFGKENVFEDEKGNLLVRDESGKIGFANKPGFSVGDIAEVGATLPEMAGGAFGAVAGGGPLSVPALVAGGAAGSAVRQAAAAAAGVPQVATPGERAKEIGVSAALSVVGGKVAQKLGSFAKSFLPKVSEKGAKLQAIAAKEGLQKPTAAQLAGGLAERQELALAEIPVFGSFVRKNLNKQIKGAEGNLVEKFGDFNKLDSDKFQIGEFLQESTQGNIKAVKKQASDIFEKIAQKGSKIKVASEPATRAFRNSVGDIGVINLKGEALEYNARTGLTIDQFKKIQGVVKSISDDLAKGKVDANTMDTLRKVIDNSINYRDIKADDIVLIELSERFKKVTQNMLNKVDKGAGREFKRARDLWKAYKQKEKLSSSLGLTGKNTTAPEKVVESIMRDTKRFKAFESLVGEKAAQKASNQFVFDILKGKAGAGQLKAQSALTNFLKKEDVLKQSLGRKGFKMLKNNLEFMAEVGRPINPSGTAFTQLITSPLSTAGAGAALSVSRLGRKGLTTAIEDAPVAIGAGIQAAGQGLKRKISEKKRK